MDRFLYATWFVKFVPLLPIVLPFTFFNVFISFILFLSNSAFFKAFLCVDVEQFQVWSSDLVGPLHVFSDRYFFVELHHGGLGSTADHGSERHDLRPKSVGKL